jgi:uncharacterized protein (DUF1697 family)
MTTWIALLRGINVGGGNRLSMKDLRSSVESLGYSQVATYIQSGNIVFDSDEGADAIVDALRVVIAERHGLAIPVVVRTLPEMEAALAGHPERDSEIDPKLLHVAFLDRAPEDPDGVEADAWLPDRWSLEGRELFLTYPDGSARSKMTIERFEKPWAVTATARNLNTVAKLVELAGRD